MDVSFNMFLITTVQSCQFPMNLTRTFDIPDHTINLWTKGWSCYPGDITTSGFLNHGIQFHLLKETLALSSTRQLNYQMS